MTLVKARKILKYIEKDDNLHDELYSMGKQVQLPLKPITRILVRKFQKNFNLLVQKGVSDKIIDKAHEKA